MDSFSNEKNESHLIYCKHCNSKWNATVQVKVCPFCGRPFVDDNKNTVPIALKKIISNNGIDILKNPKRVMSYIADYVQDEDKVKKLLRIACNTGIFEMAYEIKCESDDDQRIVLLRKAEQLLENEAFLSEDNAKFILNILMIGLDVSCGDILKTSYKVKNNPKDMSDEIENKQQVENNKIKDSDLEIIFNKATKAYDEKDYSEAFKFTLQAANQNHIEAQLNLGLLYANGQGILQDYEKAAEWFEKAANQNNAMAQYDLALLYEKGQGVPKDYKKAAEWYEKAANQNNAMAQYNLGVLYTNGHGVKQDYKKAVELYEKSANQNYAQAQNNYGYMLEHGYGVKKNKTLAKAWYAKAALQGLEIAMDNFKRMDKRKFFN